MIKTRVRRILYVDDTEEQRYVMRRILEGAGYQVVEATTGAEALALVHPDLLAIVLDVKLPDMSGYEVCRRIKADAATSSIPILQVSASFADPVLRAAGLSGGADAYVAQPVHPAELLTLVGALIRSFDSERTLRFQAHVSGKLSASLDYAETLAMMEQVFVPRFGDACYVRLLGEEAESSGGEYITEEMPEDLEAAAREVAASGVSRLLHAGALVVPLQAGRHRLGALVFTCDGTQRFYTVQNVQLAEDLGDRAALALENARLYTRQRATQEALIQSEKLASAGRLSAAIAHEINNPLESLTNLMYLMETSDEITPTLKSYVTEALSELSRLTHIARQSLGFYRELTSPVEFDLNESIEDTIKLYERRFEAKRIHIERLYAAGPLTLKAVKGEVRQVISNLLVNALDAMSEGGKLCVETEQVGTGTASPGTDVLFRVIDDGTGIKPETMARVFEPFFTTKQGTGTGLGLWVTETIVTKHGGTIEVTSGLNGRGTSFEVMLPTG